jgi:hypothetical protein
MAIIATKPNTNGTYTPAPEGVHDAVCCDVADLGIVETTWQGETKSQHKVRIVWQLGTKMEDGRPYSIGRRYGLTLHEKSSLAKDLKSWFGKPAPDNFDLEKLIGQNCQIVVTHNERDGQVYANVQSVLKAGKAKLKVDPDFVRFKDREPRPALAVAASTRNTTTDADGNNIPF